MYIKHRHIGIGMTTDVTATPGKSKNVKKNLGESFTKSIRTCCSCGITILPTCEIIQSTETIPPELSSIVSSYLQQPNIPIGYVNLHKPARRRYHVVCITCHEGLVDTVRTVLGRDWINCPARGCKRNISVNNITSNEVDEPLPNH